VSAVLTSRSFPHILPNRFRALQAGLVNALVIVIVICVMTFLMVLLYKFRCMKVLLGYLMT